MKISLLITAPPNSTGANTALRFIRAALAQQHEIYRVFFLGDGTLNSLQNLVSPQDEEPVVNQWNQLSEEFGISLVTCVSSALKRGVLDEGEANRYDKLQTMSSCHFVGGLGQLIEACLNSDRVVTF